MVEKPVVAILGAGGTMGIAVARTAARAGLSVRAWNRTADKIQALADDEIALAGTPREAATGAEMIVTLLRDGEAVFAAVDGDDGALAGADPEAVWAQMSTIGIEDTDRCIELAAQSKVTFVDAPVLGTKEPAEKGELVVLASGPDAARAACAPLFDAVGKQALWLGRAGAGTRLKLVCNSWIAVVVEGLAETMALAKGIGVDPEHFFEAISGGPLDLPYARVKGRMMMEERFDPSFKLELAAKDTDLIEGALQAYGLDLPVLRAVGRRLTEGAAEHGDLDLAATYLTSVS